MSDSVIFTYRGDYGGIKVTFDDTDTIDHIYLRLATSIFSRSNPNYIQELQANTIKMIIKCIKMGSDNYDTITDIQQLKSETYRDEETKEVTSEIYLKFPHSYRTPFRILSGISANSKYRRASPGEKAWGFHITLLAGNEVKMLPRPNTNFLRWNFLSSDRNNIVYNYINEAYKENGGNVDDENYKRIMDEIKESMRIKIAEHLVKMEENRKKRLEAVFNTYVVNLADIPADTLDDTPGDTLDDTPGDTLDEQDKKSFKFKNMISSKIQEFCEKNARRIEGIRQESIEDFMPISSKRIEGGYRKTPKRKKRRDTRRKNTKRKNTMRSKRKNTKRKNTKRKNTKKK